MSIREYALYKGESLLASGTVPEISTATGKSKSWIRYLTYPRYQRRLASRKRSSENALVLVELKEEQ